MYLINQYRHSGQRSAKLGIRPTAMTGIHEPVQSGFEALRPRPGESDAEAFDRVTAHRRPWQRPDPMTGLPVGEVQADAEYDDAMRRWNGRKPKEGV